MNKSVSLALLVIGVLLIAFGINASNSLSSEVSELFTGSPSDRAVWFLVGGAAAAIVGLYGIARGAR